MDTFLTSAGATLLGIGSLLFHLSLSKRQTVRELETHVTPVSSFKDVDQLIPLLPLLVAITGRVWTKDPIPCSLSDHEGVIVELREEKKTESRASDIWLSGTEPLRTVVREKPWAVVQPAEAVFGQEQHGGMKGADDLVMVPVLDGSHARGSYFIKSGEVFHPVEESIMQHVVSQVSGHRSLGTRQIERVLPTGQLITAVGELCQVVEDPERFEGAIRENGKMVALKAPRKNANMFILSSSSFPDIIDVYKGAAASTKTVSLYFIVAGSAMLLVTCYRRCRKLIHERLFVKRFREALQKRRDHHSTCDTESRPEGSDEDRHGVCVICMDTTSALAYPHCGHLCVCRQCSARGSAKSMCPVCRTRGKPIVIYSVS